MAGPYHQPLSRSGHKRHPSQEMGRSQSLNWKGVTLAWALGAKKKNKKQKKKNRKMHLFPITDKKLVILKRNETCNRLKLQFPRYILGNIGPVGC